jgi:hypothetical protein
MEPIRDPAVLARMRQTLDLYELAEAMMRQNLRRRYPQASEAEIEQHLLAWLRKEPRHGD